MNVVAIKFADGTYYAGCNKKHARTLLGAQLYKSEQTAKNVMETSINFPRYHSNPCQIVKVKLEEYSE